MSEKKSGWSFLRSAFLADDEPAKPPPIVSTIEEEVEEFEPEPEVKKAEVRLDAGGSLLRRRRLRASSSSSTV